MGNYGKIKSLCLGKKAFFGILAVVEAVLLAVGIVGLFGKNTVYEYGTEAMCRNFGVDSEEYGGVESQEGIQGNLVDFKGIVLPKGTYRVQLHYATDTDLKNRCEVTDAGLGQGKLRTNGVQLFSGLGHTDFEMWLLRDSRETIVHVYYDGEGFLAVQGLTIIQTNAWNRIILFCMVCLFALVDLIACYVLYDRVYGISARKKAIMFGLGIVILFAALPLMVDYMIPSGDLGYHLMRVEGIQDGVSNGQFPVRISPEWQQGFGYASPIFYGETLLYPAALFRLIGFTVTTSYRLYMFFVTVGTVLVAYFCFRKIFKDIYVGLFCSMIYSLSVYRIYKTYGSGSWGETLGILLLPLLVYGFYCVFTQDVKEESYKKSWVPLTTGFTLLVQSHLLTGELAGLFTVILCLLLWRKVIRPQTFLVLAKTVIYSVLLGAWFLVPFADYMVTGDFVIQHVSARKIQHRGLLPTHLVLAYFTNGNNTFFAQEGMYDSAAVGLGMAPIVALGLFLYLLRTGRLETVGNRKSTRTWKAVEETDRIKKTVAMKDVTEEATQTRKTAESGTVKVGVTASEKGLGKIAAGFSILAMLMSLGLFPWDNIQSWNSVAATLVSSIQFPNRFLTIANVCLTAVAGVVAKYVVNLKNKAVTLCCFGGVVFLLAASGMYLMEDMLNTSTPLRVYNSEGMGTGYIAGGEYLPYGTEAAELMYHDPACTGELEATKYKKLSLGARVHLYNPGPSDESVTFALLYYKGYCAVAEDTGEKLHCYAGENNQVTVEVPAGFDNAVTVEFKSPWYWRVGEAVSVVTLAGMFLWYFARAKKYAEKKENIRKSVGA